MISISLLAATPLSPPTARDLAGFRDAGHALAWLASDVWHGRLLELQTVEDGTVYVVDTCSGDAVARMGAA